MAVIPKAARAAIPRGTIGDLRRLGSMSIKLNDTNGRRLLHWKEGNPAEGILKAMEVLTEKAGISPDVILEEYKRRHPQQPKAGRRKP